MVVREFRFGSRGVLAGVLAAVLLVLLVSAGFALVLAGLAVALVVAVAVAAVRGVARLLGIAPARSPRVRVVHRVVRSETGPRRRYPDAVDVDHEVLPPGATRG